MTNWSLHHVNLQALDVEKSVRFYRGILGFEGTSEHTIGKNVGDIGMSQDDLAVISPGQNRGIHLLRPLPGFAKKSGMAINPAIGGHIAFSVKDLAGLKRRLDAAGIIYDDVGQGFIGGIHQIYVYDPSMNLIEINQSDAD